MGKQRARRILRTVHCHGRPLEESEIDDLLENKLKPEDYVNQSEEKIKAIGCNYILYNVLLRGAGNEFDS